jgi:hypothetical protein
MLQRIVRGVLVLAVLGAALPAPAQDTIALYADFGEEGELARTLITKQGEPFDVVVVTKTDHDSRYIEFWMTELANLYSGVFKYTTSRIGGQTIDYGDGDEGIHAFMYPFCAAAGTQEVLRVRYYDVSGSLPENVVMSVGPTYPDPDRPYVPHFPGQTGYTDCAGVDHVLTPEPWDPETGIDPGRIGGVESTAGILVLNPDGLSVPNQNGSVGVLKARY